MSAKKNTSRSREFSESIIDTVREPLIVLDQDLRVVTASRSFYEFFKVKPEETEGQLIYDLGNKQWDIPKLRELLETILPQQTTFDNYEVEHDFATIGKRIMLLNARQVRRVLGKELIILLALEDISERRLSEEKLLLAAIVESSKDAIIGKSLDGIITSWNKGAEEIYGYTASEIIGKSISVLVPPELPDEMAKILRKIKLEEGIENYETVRQRKDGQNIYVSLTVSPVYDAEGRIVGASTIARDTTERKQLEKLLVESEEQYRLLFETANDGIVLLEKSEGKIVHVNPSVEKMLGYSAKEIIRNKLQDVGLIIDNGDFQITMKNLNKRGILRFNDVPVKTKSGQHIDTDTYLVDKAKLAQCNIRDITERKRAEEELRKSEERYRLISENTADQIAILDMNLRFTYVSPNIMRLRGLTVDEAMAQTLEQVLTPESMRLGLSVFEEEMQLEISGEADPDRTRILEVEEYKKDGSTLWVEVNFSFLRDNDRKPVEIIMVSRDITERKTTEKALQSEHIMLARTEGIAHVGSWEWDIATDTVIWSDELFRIFQRDPREGAPSFAEHPAFYHPDDMARLQQAVEAAVANGTPYELELRAIRKDGETRVCVARGVVELGLDGRPVRLFGSLQDITDRKQVEEALKESEKTYRLLADNIQDVVFIMDMNLNYTYLSPSVKLLRGYEPKEAMKHTPAETLTPSSLDFALNALFEIMEMEKSENRDINISRTLQLEMSRKDGTTVWVETKASFIRDENQQAVGIMGVTRDITDRKQAENDLKESEKKYRLLADNIQDVIFVLDMNLKYTYISPSVKNMRGYEPEEVLKQQSIEQVLTPSSRDLAIKTISETMELEKSGRREDMPMSRTLQLEMIRKDGTTLWTDVKFSLIRDENQRPMAIMGVTRDITERKQADDILRESEDKYKNLINNVPDIIFTIDLEGKITFVSKRTKEILGYEISETINRNIFNFIPEEDHQRAMEDLRKGMKGGQIKHFQIPMIAKSGEKLFFECSFTRIYKDGAVIGAQGTAVNITERKKTEEKIFEINERLHLATVSAKAGIWDWNLQTNEMIWDDRMFELYGLTRENFNREVEAWEKGLHPDDSSKAIEECQAALRGERDFDTEFRVLHPDGTIVHIKANGLVLRDEEGKPLRMIGLNTDITERKQATEELKESENKYRLLADNIQDVIFVLDMNLKYTYVSPSIKTMRGYEPEEVLKQSIEQVLTPSSMDLAIKTISGIMELEKSGFREEIPMSRTLQLEMRRKDGTTLWTDVRLSFIRDENKQPIAIMGVTRDITEHKQADANLLLTLENLRKSFGATIQVMVSAIEMRDPYTSGHQLRVANLACDIAKEMGFSPDKIEGVQMAGSIHDIGKLSIPAEILSKPTKLTDIQFSLIKEHAQSGYEMLKDVESPWPLAQIVYQHHERMDGSGYPRNLKGDEILMESRIMAVADVVEAMASHRPYRAALGIKAALEEIEKNKGILYDDIVADACLKLFREKGYQLT